MNRRFRALAFAVAGGLLLVAPATTAFATSRIPFEASNYRINLSADRFREAKASQMRLIDELADVRSEAFWPIVNSARYAGSTRYAGKQVPL